MLNPPYLSLVLKERKRKRLVVGFELKIQSGARHVFLPEVPQPATSEVIFS